MADLYILPECIAVEKSFKKATGRILEGRQKVNFFVVLKSLIIR